METVRRYCLLSPDSVVSLNPVYITHNITNMVITVTRPCLIAFDIVLVSCCPASRNTHPPTICSLKQFSHTNFPDYSFSKNKNRKWAYLDGRQIAPATVLIYSKACQPEWKGQRSGRESRRLWWRCQHGKPEHRWRGIAQVQWSIGNRSRWLIRATPW